MGGISNQSTCKMHFGFGLLSKGRSSMNTGLAAPFALNGLGDFSVRSFYSSSQEDARSVWAHDSQFGAVLDMCEMNEACVIPKTKMPGILNSPKIYSIRVGVYQIDTQVTVTVAMERSAENLKKTMKTVFKIRMQLSSLFLLMQKFDECSPKTSFNCTLLRCGKRSKIVLTLSDFPIINASMDKLGQKISPKRLRHSTASLDYLPLDSSQQRGHQRGLYFRFCLIKLSLKGSNCPKSQVPQ